MRAKVRFGSKFAKGFQPVGGRSDRRRPEVLISADARHKCGNDGKFGDPAECREAGARPYIPAEIFAIILSALALAGFSASERRYSAMAWALSPMVASDSA